MLEALALFQVSPQDYFLRNLMKSDETILQMDYHKVGQYDSWKDQVAPGDEATGIVLLQESE